MRSKKTAATVLSAVLMGAGVFSLMVPASATQPDPVHKVTICHRTNSVTNPYVIETVDEAAVDKDTGNDNGQGDHNAEHGGAVFDVNADPDVAYPLPRNGDQWGDIIPPFYEDGTPGTWPSLNWDAAGQAFFEAGCNPPPPTTTTTAPTTTSTSTSTTSTSTTSTSTTSTTAPTTSTTIVGPSLFSFGAAGTECQAEVPVIVITFANTFPELAGDTGVLTVTALADDSDVGSVDVVYAPGETVEFIYPGAETDADGNIIDLPGWTLQDNGLWVIDESDAFLREGLLLTYTLGEEVATAEVTYPPESSTCANPPENPPTTTTTVPGETTTTFTEIPPPGSPGSPGLPRTGTDAGLPVALGLALIGGGLVMLDVRRRVGTPTPDHML